MAANHIPDARDISPSAPAVRDAEDIESTSSDGGDPTRYEVVVDPYHKIRRRRASLANKGSGAMLPGIKSHGGCLLHTLLDTEREMRRRSQVLFGTIGHSDGDEDEDPAYMSAVEEDRGDQEKDDFRQRTGRLRRMSRTVSPPPELLSSLSNKSESGGKDGVPIHELPPSTGYSRLLTKKQLADMAYSVRDLSKYLGTLKIKLRVRKILVITKIWDKQTIVYTSQLVDWLLSSKGDKPKYTVYVEDVLKDNELFDSKSLVIGDNLDNTREDRLKYWNDDLCEEHPLLFDLVVTLGGDGTVLYTSRLFQRIVPPVLSFNLGSLGFLTKFDFADYQKALRKLIDEGVVVSLRMRFECTVMKVKKRESLDKATLLARDLDAEILDTQETEFTHEPASTYSILNDVVVDRGPNGTMTMAELYVDDEHVTSIEADGVVIATPTGSTAYSLSAGGSLVHPDIQAMLVSPICAHSLSFRPLIVPDSAVLRVGIPYTARTTAWCCFDGKDRVELQEGDYVTISASRFPFPMIQNRKLGPDWFESLRSTLNWNQRQTQKAFNNK